MVELRFLRPRDRREGRFARHALPSQTDNSRRSANMTTNVLVLSGYSLGRSETLKKFHSHVLPLSGEKAWPHTGRSLFRASQRKTTRIGLPLSVSLPKKWPTPFWSNEPTTGGSIFPVLLAIQ